MLSYLMERDCLLLRIDSLFDFQSLKFWEEQVRSPTRIVEPPSLPFELEILTN